MIITIDELKNISNKDTIMCAGWYDMFHIGHLNFLNKAKTNADKLIVVVRNDADGKYIKGTNRPIIKQEQRALIVDNLKCVDYTIMSEPIHNKKTYYNEIGLKNATPKTLSLWDRYVSIVEEFKPTKIFTLEETMKFNGLGDYISKLGIDVIYTDRFEGISTTDIEKKIKNNKM